MRVLLVNDYRVAGGAEVVVEAEAAALREAGHEVAVLTAEESPGERRAGLGAALRYVSNGPACRRLSAELDRFRPDIVHLHNLYHAWSPAVLGVLARWKRADGRGVVLTAHDHHVVCPNPGGVVYRKRVDAVDTLRAGPPWPPVMASVLAGRWDGSRARSWLRVTQHVWHYRVRQRLDVLDAVIAPSSAIESALRGAMRSAANRVVVVRNPSLFSSGGISKPSGGSLRVVFAGRLEPEKGVFDAIDSWPMDLGTRLIVLGDGSELENCQAMVEHAGLDAEFEGRVSRERVSEVLASAHVVLVPSTVEEADGLSAVEGLAHGAAVLATDGGRMRELLGIPEDGWASARGVVFRGRSGAELRRGLEELIARRAAGTLNAFDASGELRGRSPAEHAAALVGVYERAIARG